MEDHPFLRAVKSPITEDQLRPLDARCRVVQFNAPLSESDFIKLADFLKQHPHVSLRIYGHYQSSTDLTFLHHFPFLERFQADVFELQNWDGLSHLPETLKSLSLGPTRRKFSLKSVARFSHLTDLYLDGHSKDIAVVGELSALVHVTLRSIRMPDLAILRTLRQLRTLALKLGGTNKLNLLDQIPSLRYLELWRVRGLEDLSALTMLPELRYLFLQDLTNVRSLPSFRALTNLQRCHVENLKSLSDLRPIAAAPNLKELLILNMRHIAVDGLRCFQGHAALTAATIGLCNLRRNAEATEMLGIGPASNANPFDRYVESA